MTPDNGHEANVINTFNSYIESAIKVPWRKIAAAPASFIQEKSQAVSFQPPCDPPSLVEDSFRVVEDSWKKWLKLKPRSHQDLGGFFSLSLLEIPLRVLVGQLKQNQTDLTFHYFIHAAAQIEARTVHLQRLHKRLESFNARRNGQSFSSVNIPICFSYPNCSTIISSIRVEWDNIQVLILTEPEGNWQRSVV